MKKYYLEMTSSQQLNEKPQVSGLTIVEAEIKEYRFNRYLYQLIGEPWNWIDRLNNSPQQWQEHTNSVRTWVAYNQGSIAGYYELKATENGDVEVAHFGLAPDFLEKKMGGYLLSCAIKSAWLMTGCKRVWLHTCTDDHPSALQNYKSRGFRLYKDET